MSAEVNSQYELSPLSPVADPNGESFKHLLGDFENLLEALDGDSRYTAGLPMNLERAVNSDTTTIYGVRQNADGPVVSTATLNHLPVLSGRGSAMWIDDVVTLPQAQGKGLSRLTMNAMENQAGLFSDTVSLTSGVELASGIARGPAINGYGRRGYVLGPGGLAVYRNTQLHRERPEGTELLTEYKDSDVEDIAELLGEDPGIVGLNLRSVLAATHAAVLVRKHEQKIRAVVVSNLSPIPTGMKPWLYDVAAATPQARSDVIGAAEYWMAKRGAPYANIVAASSDGLPENYALRSSGLFIKNLRNPEA